MSTTTERRDQPESGRGWLAEAIRAGAWLRCPHGEPAAGTRGDGAERIGHDGTPQG